MLGRVKIIAMRNFSNVMCVCVCVCVCMYVCVRNKERVPLTVKAWAREANVDNNFTTSLSLSRWLAVKMCACLVVRDEDNKL